MFEKEAEEYLIRNLCKTCLTICENNCPHAESEKRAFKDGAEFGYNKALEEWKKHFLQCSSPFCLDIFSSVKCYGELGNMTKKESE